jgi:hypothetical protein
VVLVDELLERADRERRAAEVVDLGPVLLVALLLRAEALLVGHKLLLDQQPVLDALELERAELAARGRRDGRELGAEGGRAAAARLLAHARRRRRRLPLLLLRLFLVLHGKEDGGWAVSDGRAAAG